MSATAVGTECIEWRRQIDAHGYGLYFKRGSGYGKKDWRRGLKAHRKVWEDAHGPIPEGMHVHHRCGNRRCVNVEHLELLSNADHHGARGHGKLVREQAEEIRDRRAAGERSVELAEEYGVSAWTVYDILGGRIWK